MTSTRSVDYGEGKTALLQATVRVVAHKGLRGLTFRAVADEAGVNNTLIAHHFGTRDRLLAATLEWSVDESLAHAPLREYLEAPAAFATDLLERQLPEPAIHVFQVEMIAEASRRPELQHVVRDLYERYLAGVASGRSAIGEPANEDLDRAMFAALDGLMLQFLGGAITPPQYVDAIRALSAAVARAPAATQLQPARTADRAP